jgi:glutaredoxin-like YruB-family protein
MNKEVIIYSTPTCHFCHAAKDFFDANNVEYTDINVAGDPVKINELVEKSGQRGVPVILIDGEVVVGYNEDVLREMLEV